MKGGRPVGASAPPRATASPVIPHDPSTAERASSHLSKRDLARVVAFGETCLEVEHESELHRSILAYADAAGFEFVLYAYMRTSYRASEPVALKNLSNPPAWMAEYAEKSYVANDPVRRELELRLARGELQGAFVWDHYDRDLTDIEQEIIARRRHWGLRAGFSAFCDSPRHDAVFLVSFATRRRIVPGPRALVLGRLIVPHLNRCRKRLDLVERVGQLTLRERTVARWLVDGKTNGEIAGILRVSEATAKYHVANILTKLQATNRQSAVSMLIAERCLA